MRLPFVSGLMAAVCAAVVSLGTPAVAVTPSAPAPGGPTPGGSASSGALSARDRAFLTAAAHGAQFEVVSGRLAADRAADPRVRSFGSRMVRDHGKEYQQLQQLDRGLGLTAPSGPGPDQQKVVAIWQTMRGGPFDCSYAPVMYADHEDDLSMFMMTAGHADDPRVRAFAEAQVPVLRQHLQMANRNLTGLKCSAPPRAPSAS